ncbi:MAG: prepilin peptidase [Lachnospiraceae bacterium]|nr:prepilin peptidase [Lachnospiraceae bacterium]
MIFIIPIVTAVLCLLSTAVMFLELDRPKDIAEADGAAIPKGADDAVIPKEADDAAILEEADNHKSGRPAVYCILMICITMAISAMFCTLYKDNNIFTSLKRMGLLAIIWPVAYIDFKEYRIPNRIIGLGVLYRLLLIPCELLVEGTAMRYDLLSEGIAAIAILVAAILCTVCMRGSIGVGDMKLFFLMGLLLGLDGIWGAVFLALIISFFVSIFLLATKRKSRKDAIPFGPALVIGTFLSVALTGM